MIIAGGEEMNNHQVRVAAESFTATLFAWAGYDISVQYGANQPEYDLVVVRGDKMLKVSVKGSQDGGWGLIQSYKKDRSYEEAANFWVAKHTSKTIVSLVQFKDVNLEKGEFPRVYIDTPYEVGEYLKRSRGGYGFTAVREEHLWTSGVAKGKSDLIPQAWVFGKKRIVDLMNQLN
jgi:Holliday junction resolvase-like predicted endonuclease